MTGTAHIDGDGAATRATVRAVLGERAGDAVVHDVYDGVGAPIYEDLCRDDTHEVRELLGLVRLRPGDVLDLAAGAGRLSLPLVAAGRRVVALERSPAMAALLRQRLATAPARLRARLTVVEADMRDFDLGRRFGAVVLGTTSISLLDEPGRRRLFACMGRHLAPGGRFLVSTVSLAGGAAAADVVRDVTGHSGRTYRMAESVAAGGRRRVVAIAPPPEPDRPPVVCTSVVEVVPVDVVGEELDRAGFTVHAVHVVRGGDERYHDVLLEAGVT